MIEKVAGKENVSIEEARAALKAADGDIIDAIVFLERKAKMKEAQAAGPAADTTAQTEEKAEKEAVKKEAVQEEMMKESAMHEEKAGDETMREGTAKEETGDRKSDKGAAVRGVFGKIKDILVNNALIVTRNEEEKLRLPAWMLAVILICFFRTGVIALIVSMFFGCRYSFVGKNDLKRANEAMDKAGDVVDKVKAQFN